MMVKDLFENHQLFRRIILLIMCGLTIWVTIVSRDYAFAALYQGADWNGTIAILGLLQGPVTIFTGWLFHRYIESRRKTN